MTLKLKKLLETIQLQEMPFAEYGSASIDLQVEKYVKNPEEQKRILRAFNAGKLSGYSTKYKKWVLLSPDNIKILDGPTEVVLPNEWEKYKKFVV